MNPILPRNEYIPDGEAHVWSDGRLYLYGSRDIGGASGYCSESYKVFSTDDLVHWTDHGISFEGKQADFCSQNRLYAPDCGCRDGKYYLYFCMPGDGGREGVAVSTKPEGPFSQATAIEGADTTGIDPTVLVDDDGQAYLYWGQFELRGAKLNADMRTIEPGSIRYGLLTEAEHGFHEGASIHKIGSRYCMVYCDTSRGRATCLSYAWGDSPFGPFKRGGVIIDNIHCDAMSWNNHGSIIEFKGQWYVFYHRSSADSRANRRACIEPIKVHSDGHIDEVLMTTQGVSGPIPASTQLEGWRACHLYGRIHTQVEEDREFLTSKRDGSTAAFRYLEFSGSEASCQITVRGKGVIAVSAGSVFTGPLAKFDFDTADQWQTLEMPLQAKPKGIHALSLLFIWGKVDLESVQFK